MSDRLGDYIRAVRSSNRSTTKPREMTDGDRAVKALVQSNRIENSTAPVAKRLVRDLLDNQKRGTK